MRILIRLLTCQRGTGRGAQEALRVLGPAEIEVAVVLPRHPEPAMQLQCVACHTDEGLGAVRPGYRSRLGQFGALFTRARDAECAAGGGKGALDQDGHVNTAVLQGLERPDRPAELEPAPKMVERAGEYLLARAH